mmetsp:Transcript_40463/g.73155  ORF Transcript_40463/g.73155 Transcript_40463/m.73155 type:complete len:122 (+) Transcript_40463:201-566(+)
MLLLSESMYNHSAHDGSLPSRYRPLVTINGSTMKITWMADTAYPPLQFNAMQQSSSSFSHHRHCARLTHPALQPPKRCHQLLLQGCRLLLHPLPQAWWQTWRSSRLQSRTVLCHSSALLEL